LEAFLISTGIVALAEIGDKTQLLALLLAARFKKPWPIVWGIFVATVLNHALAGALGAWLSMQISPQILRWMLGASFIAMAVWMLIPDKLDAKTDKQPVRFGVLAPRWCCSFWPRWVTKRRLRRSCWQHALMPT